MKDIRLTRIALSIAVTTALVWSIGCGSSGFSSGGSSSDPQPKLSGTLSFINFSNPATNPQPISVAAADFNGDGKLDLAVPADGGLNVLMGNGDGTFRAAPAISLPQINNVAVADFNGDGKLDLAVSLPDMNQVEMLLGNGDGTFTPMPVVSFEGVYSVVAAGDLNGDGKADLIVVSTETMTILLGNGNGTFASGQVISISGGLQSVVLGDFNRDGKTDLAVVHFFSETVTVLLGKGDGTFTQLASSSNTGYQPVAIAAADFNRDGILDLAITNQNGGYPDPGSVTVLFGKGDGTFTPGFRSLVTDSNPESIAAVDFMGYGRYDLVVVNAGGNTVTVFPGNGDGTFAGPISVPTGSNPLGLAVRDFNGDGIPDLAVAAGNDNSVNVLLAHVTPTP